MNTKEASLRKYIKDLGSAVVAFSGGVDSTLVLKIALEELGKNKILAIIANSKTYPKREIQKAEKRAQQIGINFQVIETDELRNKKFRSNPPKRCFYCKSELFSKLRIIAKERGLKHIIDGSNADDEDDFRPGNKAANNFGVISPLKKSGFNKKEVRQLAKKLGLVNWDKPSLACLSSRFPYGQIIESNRLEMVEKAEYFLQDLGIKQVRVRIDNCTARIEIDPCQFFKVIDNSEKILKKLKKLGFLYITLDLEGYKSGKLNRALPRLKEADYA